MLSLGFIHQKAHFHGQTGQILAVVHRNVRFYGHTINKSLIQNALWEDKSKIYKKKQLSIDSCLFDVGVL